MWGVVLTNRFYTPRLKYGQFLYYYIFVFGVCSVIVVVYDSHFMIKKLFKIRIWRLGECVLLQELDKYLSDDETKNFKVAKQYRGTIEEVQKRNPKEPSQTPQTLGQTIIEPKI